MITRDGDGLPIGVMLSWEWTITNSSLPIKGIRDIEKPENMLGRRVQWYVFCDECKVRHLVDTRFKEICEET